MYQTGSGAMTSAVCTSCSSGSYQTGSGVISSISCTLCDAGMYQTGSGMTQPVACTLCDSGTYQSGSGASLSLMCTACDYGTYQTGSGFTASVECSFCSSGTYQSGSGISSSSVCALCDAGTYQSGSGMQSSALCFLCDSGTFQTGSGSFSSLQCLACSAGTYQTGSGNPALAGCTFCDAGTYQTGSGVSSQTNCQICTTGSYQTGSGITASIKCALCDAGTYQTGSGMISSVQCSLCAAGTYETGSGMTASLLCQLCSAGTYQTGSGATSLLNCTMCLPGSYLTGSGASWLVSCTFCDSGSYQTGSGMTASALCTLCDAGSFQTGSGIALSMECLSCSTGTYQTGSGISSESGCTLCSAGAYQDQVGASASEQCLLCDSGTYQTGFGIAFSISCLLCDAGAYQTGSGSSASLQCLLCGAGMFQTGSGRVSSNSCLECGTGKYQTGQGMTSSKYCAQCTAGTFQTGNGMSSSSRCELCQPGEYSTGYGFSGPGCIQCDRGQYQSGQGETSCNICGAGKFQTGYGLVDAENCSLCSAGTYQTGHGMNSVMNCSKCPIDKYTISAGIMNESDCICNTGFFQNEKDNVCTPCIMCHQNATDEGGCPFGSLFDNTICVCNSGFFGDGLADGFGCLACEAGQFLDGEDCSSCPIGSFSQKGADSLDSCLCNVGFFGSNGSACQECPAGTYKTSTGPAPCTRCHANSSSSAGSFLSSSCECNAGFTWDGSSCSQCEAGKYGPGGTNACVQCKVCDSNAAGVGSCPPGTGPVDGVSCQCNMGLYGNGESCISEPLPIPQLVSIDPSSGFCIEPSQQVVVQVRNFPAFYRTDVTASWNLAGQTYDLNNFDSIGIEIAGNLLSSYANLTLKVNGPGNDAYGTALFNVFVNVGMQMMQVSFFFEFKPYIVGNPFISFVSPSFLYELSRVSVYLEIKNILPFVNSSNIVVSFEGVSLPSIKIIQSTLSLTSLNIIGDLNLTKGYSILVISSLDSQSQLRSAEVSLPVEALPEAILLTDSLFPKSSSAGPLLRTSRLVQVNTRYLAPDISNSDVTVIMRTQAKNSFNLTVISVSEVDASCLEILCSVHTILFMLPSQGNPDGANITEKVFFDFLVSGRILGSALFEYISVFDSFIDFVVPSSQSVNDAGLLPITIFGRNFPPPSCATQPCANEISSLSIRFGVHNGAVKSFAVYGNLIAIVCLSPFLNQSGAVAITVDALLQTSLKHRYLTFPFTFTIPPAATNPQDGTSNGNTKVNITAVGWGPIVRRISTAGKEAVFVKFGNIVAFVERIVLALVNMSTSILIVEIRTPEKPRDGDYVVSCIIGTILAPINSTFSWTYYAPPTIESVMPSQATVDGVTSSGDGSSVSIVLGGFPVINAITEVDIYFNVAQTSPRKATVTSLENTLAVLILNVSVPSTDLNAAASITASLTRPGFEIRRASFAPFQYYDPSPAIQSILWCRQCNMGKVCLINGQCQNSSRPLYSQAALFQAGVLTVIVENWYNATLGVYKGSYIFFSRINTKVYLSRLSVIYENFGKYSTVGVEFILPAFTLAEQCSGAVLQINTKQSVNLGNFNCVDPRFTVSCKSWPSLNDTVCAGPAVQNQINFSIIFRIFGPFPVSSFEDMLSVTFGKVPARNTRIISISSDGKYFELLARPPDFAFSGPQSTVDATISKANNSVTIPWIFWNSPKIVTAYFSTLGTTIFVIFDQPTKIDRVSASNENCSVLFDDASIQTIALYPFDDLSCKFSSDQSQLIVDLGNGATIIPNQFLTLRSSILGSVNGLSALMASTSFQVNRPLILSAPTITVVGPSTVDPCSPLNLFAFGNSARNLSFRWSSLNDAILNQSLQNLSPTPTVQLSAGTPEMQTSDKTYVISVQAIDFFGSSSSSVSIQVLKTSSAAPNIIFWPSNINAFSNQGLVLSSVAMFSSCSIPEAELNFSWTMTAGPKLSADVQALVSSWSSPQVFLPSYSLQAGGTYVFLLHLEANGDPSIFSEASLTLTVGFLPVIATVTGGSAFQRYQFSTWYLDASGSRDLDKLPNSQQLVYKWKCTLSDGTSTRACLNSAGLPLVINGTSIVAIESGALGPTMDYPYVFSVTVQDAALQKPPDTAVVSVYVMQTAVTVFSVQILSNFQSIASSQPVVNSNNKLVLFASCSEQVSWSVQPSLAASKISSSALPSGFSNSYFIIDGRYNVLSGGTSYTFQANCFKNGNGTEILIGSTSQSLIVNEAPSGGKCFACVLGGKGCSTTGAPISTVFRISCVNWADLNGPITYSFGFSVSGDSIAWLAPMQQPFVDIVFPTGTIQVFAEIFDALGASTGVILLSPNNPLSITRKGTSSARMLLQSGQINWTVAAGILQNQVFTKSVFDINFNLVSLAYEMMYEYQSGLLNTSVGQDYAQSMLTLTQTVLTFTPRTQKNICAFFVVLEKLAQAPQLLNSASQRITAEGIRSGVSDHTFIATLDQDCVISAVNTLSNVMIAVDFLPLIEKQYQDIYLLSVNSDAMALLVLLFSSSLTIADPPFLITTKTTTLAISRKDRTGLAQHMELSFNLSLMDTTSSSASFTLPFSLEGVNKSMVSFSVLEKITNYSPISAPDIIQRSPLFGLTVFPYGNSSPLELQNLSNEIRILMPLKAMPEADWLKFRYQAVCMYWDAVLGTFSTTGLQLISANKSFAICTSKHLTDFVVTQNITIPQIQSTVGASRSGLSQTTSAYSMINLILTAVGDNGGPTSQSWAIAKMNWIPFTIAYSDFQEAILKVLLLTGNKSNSSVTIIAIPGFIMKTVVGVSYSSFRAALSSSAPLSMPASNTSEVSSIVNFTLVQGSVPVQMEGLRFSTSRRQAACQSGVELRYTKVGEVPEFACRCPANLDCTAPTTCSVVPSQGDQWLVVTVPNGLCSATTPPPAGNVGSDATALGLGVGLGLGVPICLLILMVFYYSSKPPKPGARYDEKPEEAQSLPLDSRPVLPPDADVRGQAEQIHGELPLLQKPPLANMTVAEQFEPIAFNSQLVFSSNQAPATFSPPTFETTLFSSEPPLQLTNYWDLPYHQHQFPASPEMPYMPTYNPYDLQDPSTRRFMI